MPIQQISWRIESYSGRKSSETMTAGYKQVISIIYVHLWFQVYQKLQEKEPLREQS